MNYGRRKDFVAYNALWATKKVVAHLLAQGLRPNKICRPGKGDGEGATTFATTFFVAPMARATKIGYGLRFLL